ncbi:hypothetical protein AAC387_Pa07g2424 [Persea americana]
MTAGFSEILLLGHGPLIYFLEYVRNAALREKIIYLAVILMQMQMPQRRIKPACHLWGLYIADPLKLPACISKHSHCSVKVKREGLINSAKQVT